MLQEHLVAVVALLVLLLFVVLTAQGWSTLSAA
jgi:hypothetical protein